LAAAAAQVVEFVQVAQFAVCVDPAPVTPRLAEQTWIRAFPGALIAPVMSW